MRETILVCTDGEAHSRDAILWSIRLAKALKMDLTGLHVADTYLKKFTNELYSQGRQQYLDYVDGILEQKAQAAEREFRDMCATAGLADNFRQANGDPLEEILLELDRFPYTLVVVGGKRQGAWQRFRSGNLPGRLQKNSAIPLLAVKPATQPPS